MGHKQSRTRRGARVAISLLTLVFACAGDVASAQDRVAIDSVRKVFASARNDTTRIGALLALSELLYTSDPDTNMVLCRQAIGLTDIALTTGVTKTVRSTLLRQKATAINNLAASHYMFGELDSALACFRTARAIHEANGSIDGVGDSWNNEGIIHEARGDHRQQRRCLFEALAVYRRSGRTEGVGYALNNIGNYYSDRGAMDSALIYLDSSLTVFEGMGDEHGMARALLNIGMNHKKRGRPAEALEQFLKCQKVYEDIGDKTGLATCLNNIASIYHEQGMPTEAMAYYHDALDLNTELGDRNAMGNNRMNLGTVLDEQGELDMALKEFDASLSLFQATGDRGGEALVHGHLGNVWKNKGVREKALEHFRTSLRISKELDSPSELSNAYYKSGHFFEDGGRLDSALWYYHAALELDRSIEDRESESFTLYSIAGIALKQGRLRDAEVLAEQALTIAQEIGYPVNIMRATQVLHEALARQGRWGRALEILELHQQMKDSVNNAENARKTVQLQMRYDFGKKQLADSLSHVTEMNELENENRIATLEAEQARNRAWAYGIGGAILLGGGGLVYRIDRKRRRERFERDAARLQMQVLRTQMNPHFIFNALNSINSYVQENERELASGFLTKFARLMRLVLENSRHNEVPLNQDLEALRLYMDLERARMSGKFDYVIDVDPALDQGTAMVPPLVLQPFVENAIWHGISGKEGRGLITLKVRHEHGMLIMSVEDDGVGRTPIDTTDPAGPATKTSLGTAITRDRLAVLGMQQGMAAGFSYTDLPQGTRVIVQLPLKAA